MKENRMYIVDLESNFSLFPGGPTNASPRLGPVPSNVQLNRHAKPNQVQNKKEKQKEGCNGEGKLQCATINCSPPKSRMSGVTFHLVLKKNLSLRTRMVIVVII